MALDERLVRAQDLIEQARSLIEAVRDDTQAEFDELSEQAQEGPRGERLQENVAYLDELSGSLDDIDIAGNVQ